MEIIFHSLYPELMRDIPQEVQELKGVLEIYTDDSIVKSKELDTSKAVAMLVEPRSIIPSVYEYIEKNWNRFAYVFTFDSELLSKLVNAKLLLFGTVCGFFDESKTKGISMVCSDKHSCKGHIDRRNLALSLKGKIDTYGRFDGGEFASLHDILAPYKFNVAVENYKNGYYFTEKICNCFASKTIPIYYGSDKVNEYFNSDGIINVQNLDEIPKIIEQIDIDKEYEKRLQAVEDNYEKVKEFANFGLLFCRMNMEFLKEVADEKLCAGQ